MSEIKGSKISSIRKIANNINKMADKLDNKKAEPKGKVIIAIDQIGGGIRYLGVAAKDKTLELAEISPADAGRSLKRFISKFINKKVPKVDQATITKLLENPDFITLIKTFQAE